MLARRVAMPWLPEMHTDEETRAWVRDILLPHQALADEDGANADLGQIGHDDVRGLDQAGLDVASAELTADEKKDLLAYLYAL